MYGIIFVVDASSADRLEEAKEGLQAVMRDERVAGKPLLIFANKQDRDGALGESEIKSGLEMDQIGGEERGGGGEERGGGGEERGGGGEERGGGDEDQVDEGRTEGRRRGEGEERSDSRQQTHVVSWRSHRHCST